MNWKEFFKNNKKLIIIITIIWLIILVGFIIYNLINIPILCIELTRDSEGKMLTGGCHPDYSLLISESIVPLIIIIALYVIIIFALKKFKK